MDQAEQHDREDRDHGDAGEDLVVAERPLRAGDVDAEARAATDELTQGRARDRVGGGDPQPREQRRQRGGDPHEAQLRGTVSAPRAQASADITRNDAGFRITLDANGLPALRSGAYYQAWLKNAAGALVPIGTFSSSDGRVTLWSGLSPKDFPTLTVTIEATDNDQTSSGRQVLVGEVRAT